MAERIEDTIVAIATPLGSGGLGVIRLSGPGSIFIASSLFLNPSTDFSHAKSHTLHHGWVGLPDKKIDEAVFSLFRSPHSYTGEDVVEISTHGSPAVLKEVVDLCLQKGARPARPGEFTQRAYLNGKMDLAQAEAVADLISAGSSSARIVAADQLRGVLSERIKAIRQPLIDLLAHMEANLDFVEEDIPNLPRRELKAGLEKIEMSLSELLSTSLKGRNFREGIRVALVGRPNVGKSSLFNALLAQDRAIVTNIPGTTRDTIEERLEWDNHSIVLTDTAGLRESHDEVEKKGTERTQQSVELADLVAIIFDASEDLTAEDRALAHRVTGKKTLVVLNKCDKKIRLTPPHIQSIHPSATVTTSALRGEGLLEFKQTVLKLTGLGRAGENNSVVVTNLRHVQHLEKASEKIRSALLSLENSQSEESLSLDLRSALNELGAITGENISEEILSSIFSQFCIGK